MKEKKFRTWEKATRRLRSWKETLCSFGLTALFIEPETFGLIVDEYTGLKDKNGVEIYEGDVVKFLNADDNDSFRIEYIQDYMTFCPFNQNEWEAYKKGSNHFKYCYQEDDEGGYEGHFLSMFESYEVEVIGNIHENPELLETIDEGN